MKTNLLIAAAIIAFGFLVGLAWATFGSDAAESRPARQGVVTAADAAAHVGETVTVEGVVSEVHVSERATFIDFNGRYPNEKITGVIFTSDAGAFANVDAYEGKTVEITGTVKLYHGRPEIILTSPGQIRTQ